MRYNQLIRHRVIIQMSMEIQYYHSIIDTSGTIGLFGRGLGGIGTTIYTVVVTLYFAVTGCGMIGSSTGSATETISG